MTEPLKPDEVLPPNFVVEDYDFLLAEARILAFRNAYPWLKKLAATETTCTEVRGKLGRGI